MSLRFTPDFMAITKLAAGEEWELAVSGRVDGGAANDLEVEIIAAMRAGARVILVDLSAADWICSAGIRVLLQYFRQMKNNQKTLRVSRPSPAVAEILALTGFDQLIYQERRPQS